MPMVQVEKNEHVEKMLKKSKKLQDPEVGESSRTNYHGIFMCKSHQT